MSKRSIAVAVLVAAALVVVLARIDASSFDEVSTRGTSLIVSAARARGLFVDAARTRNDPSADAVKKAKAAMAFDDAWSEASSMAEARGDEAARLATEIDGAIAAWRGGDDASFDVARAAMARLGQVGAADVEVVRDRAHRTEEWFAIGATGLFLASLLVLAGSRKVEPTPQREQHGSRARVVELEREHHVLHRRLALVCGGSEGGLAGVGRRIVEAVAEETGATHVVLHVASLQKDDLRAIADRGDGAPVERKALDGVFKSADAVTIEHAGSTTVLRPLSTAEQTIGVIELVVPGHVEGVRLLALDELLAAIAPTVGHLLTAEYAHALSDEVRAQTLTVEGVSAELATVFEALADGLAVTNERGAIIRINAAGRAILGIPSDAPLSDVALDPHNPLRHALGEGRRASGLEVALGGGEGDEPRIIQVKISPLSHDEGSRAAVAVFRDVTRERLLEHALRGRSSELAKNVRDLQAKKDELERATRLKSEFLANMSHELRTPLNAVIGFAEVLLDGTYGTLNDKQMQCTQHVLAGGRHLLNLINDLLDLSKIEAGKMELSREDLDLADVVSQAITLIRPQASTKEIQLRVEVPQRQFSVHADADRLRQVLVNLLSNAVKFTPNGGNVAIEASIEGNMIKVAVIDDGVGIASEHAGKLFKEFSQVDGSITRRFGGTGLGLAICKRLVEMHGGTIGFQSAIGEGSTFFFVIPRAMRSERPAFAAPRILLRGASVGPALSRSMTKRSILVVEPAEAAQRLVAGVLREAHFQPVVVATLAEAKSRASAGQFEAIVIEPEVHDASIEAAIEFAGKWFGSATVITTARSIEELSSLIPKGAAVLQKPLDRAHLLDRVRDAVARRGHTWHALVVDGSEVDGDAVRALLERDGIVTELVGTLDDARASLSRRHVDLLVLELDLPDGDGIELLRTLERDRSMKRVVLTARTLDPQQVTSIERLAEIVTSKGSLSRTAFSRRIQAVLRAGNKRVRVLTVDDNEQNLRLIGAVLSRQGYEILEARDAVSAVAIARAEHPDLIVMDVMLPDMDGLTATRELKKDVLTRGIPVIAVTANAMPGDAEKAAEAGCAAYVTKPIEAAHLLAVIERSVRAA